MSHTCRCCQQPVDGPRFAVPELQLGKGTEFPYAICTHCGTMNLLEAPDNLGDYYPNEDYYSFHIESKPPKEDKLRALKAGYLLYGKNPVLGRLLSLGYKMPDYYHWMKRTGAQPGDRILDVGCGNGGLLTQLYAMGFRNLTGIDPFIRESFNRGPIRILKKEIVEVEERFDLVMMHHSLEHMFEPLDALKQAHRLLGSGKPLLLRIPVMGHYGWQKYGLYWCGLDAPRHLFIPTEEGVRQLAAGAGFKVEGVEYDSSDYVIWSSEQYLKGIPLHAPESRMRDRNSPLFTREQIQAFRQTIRAENERGNGDTAAFYLRAV